MDGQTDFSRLSAEATLKLLGSSKKGLALAEAHKRLAANGPNTLKYSPMQWLAATVRSLARNTFFWILLVASLIAWLLGDGHITLALIVALAANVLAEIGFLRHNGRFVTHLERLLHAPVTVTRSSKRLQIEADELVLGDIVHLAHNETIPADLRLIDTDRLELDESNLTGSLAHSTKVATIGEHNLALCGTTVVNGSGRGVVIALSRSTVLGSRINTIDKASNYATSPSQLRLRFIRKRIAIASIMLTALLVTFALVTHTTLADFWFFAILLAVALVPLGLTSELALLQRISSAPVAWIIRCAISDVGAKLSLVILGILGQVFWHIPLAITIVQIIAIDLIAQLLPITALGGDRPRQFTNKVAGRLLGFGAISATLTYANFLFFFERSGISPVYLDNKSALYFHAVTLSFATIVLCRFVNILTVRSDLRKQFFTRYMWSNPRLGTMFAVAVFLVLFAIYYPPLQHYFDTQPLSLTDWLSALLVTAIFFGLQLLQRHTRQHTRAAVLELHKKLS